MAYVCEVGSGRTLYLDQVGPQTVITVVSHTAGQQQQASSTFPTGDWQATPEVYLTTDGAVVKLATAKGIHYIRVHGSSIGVSEALSLDSLQQIQMQQSAGVTTASLPPMPPMAPMPPMSMGNMQMNANPMEMQMGNMTMRMGEPPTMGSPTSDRHFCSQCGAAVRPGDRFCSQCGHKLGD